MMFFGMLSIVSFAENTAYPNKTEDIGDTIILVEDVEGFEKILYELNRRFLTVYYKIINEIKAYISLKTDGG